MTKIFVLTVVCAVFALPVHAGQGTIRETDTQIIVEYTGGDEDVKASKAREEELESKRQVEQAEIKQKEETDKINQEKLEKAARKGANKVKAFTGANGQ